MKKKNFIIISSVLVLIMIGLIILLVLKGNSGNQNKISEELRKAREVFDIELSKNNDEYIIYGLKKTANIDGSTITIPDSVDKIPVTKLVDKDLKNFSDFCNIGTIIIGKNISYIGTTVYNNDSELIYGENIFSGASRLVQIVVSNENNVFSSENGILYNKDKTILIKYPAGKTLNVNQASHTFKIPDSVNKIYQKAFFNNVSIETVNFGINVKEIGKDAFNGCSKLSKISLNDGLELVSSRAFEGCKLLDGVEFRNGLRKISYHAFYNCSKLSSIYIPNTLEELEANVFIGCSTLKKIYTSNDNVENLKNLLTQSKHFEIVEFVSYK